MSPRLDPIGLSVFASALAGVAEEMGALLVRGAYSSNIKERRDCSVALFDARGRMVAQAAHIPGHLGALPDAVAAVIQHEPQPGDVFALNDPFSGGTHLPDITLVSPIVVGLRIIAYAATRAHHSDVGGMRPGSMPSDSREIFQEGLVIPVIRLISGGRPNDDVLALVLANVRTPTLRRGDLRAQLASHALAERRIREFAERYKNEQLSTLFEELLKYSETRSRAAIGRLPDGTYRARGVLEGDGVEDRDIAIVASVSIRGEAIVVDLTESSPAVAGNVNCTISVTRSAACFAMRVLLPPDVPSNAGTYAPLEVRATRGSVVYAERPSAVVAGNVETCQCVADVVLLALAQAADLPAQGQGSMNNLVVGGRGWTYYETIGGGQGANRQGDGPSGIHVSMTNTLNTPIEALELEYPMRVERYELRYESGGSGLHRGGDGVVREIRLLEPGTVCLLTERRRHPPLGSHGGGPGAVGENLHNGTSLPSKAIVDASGGDVITVLTPGGGGWGYPSTQSDSGASPTRAHLSDVTSADDVT